MSEDHFLNLQPGTIVNGRYEVVKCLGTGSMGLVYACRHRELSGLIVAMKVLFSEVARDEVAAARFRNEIVASYGVSHPNVVRAYEYFRDGDLIAFTMEYVGGGDLADRLSLEEQLPISEIVRFLVQMCAGVQAIHDAGIIHRDLKPENILLTTENNVKITDFGIARTGTGPKLTEHGGVVGTIDYVSPEYLEVGQVDARSDIYALGVLAYEMVTGQSPFQGKSVVETMTIRLKTDPVPPIELRADCPVQLSAIIMRALKRNPEERYQSAKEILSDLGLIKLVDYPGATLEELANFDATALHARGVSKDSTQDSYGTQEIHQGGYATSAPAGMGYSGAHRVTTPMGSSHRNPTVAYPPSPYPEEYPDELSYSPKKMESVLKPRMPQPAVSQVGGSGGFQPSVSVSDSRFSTVRMQQLSDDSYEAEESPFKTVLWWLLIAFVGFGLGLLILSYVQPNFSHIKQVTGAQSMGVN